MKTSRAVARKVRTKSNVEKFLTYVGSYAKAGEEQSIVKAILADHDALKEFIKELKDEKTPAAKKRALYPKFESLLTSHTIAEEKALYSVAVNIKELKTKTLEGKVEHDVAKALSKTIKAKPSAKEFDTWSAKVQVLAE
ncbi:MAG: hemerythrin domain-containing protein, partial [Proteobacteria bacterium]